MPSALKDNDFLVNEQRLGFFFFFLRCFPVEISLRAWRGQCVCRSGRGIVKVRLEEERRGPKNMLTTWMSIEANCTVRQKRKYLFV